MQRSVINCRGGTAVVGRSTVARGLGFAAVMAVCILAALMPQSAQAVDADNCLMCHRFRGLARVDKEGDYRLFYVDEELFGRGPHARVSCKGCHSDVDKIPHADTKPVDCLQNCHIDEPTREIIFTHSKVETSLKDSVHSLVNADGSPSEMADDLPECRDCHDMPLFRPVAMFKTVRAGVSEQAINRCLGCHNDEHFARYYYSHVTTRLHKARDPREVVTMCANCHSDVDLARRHGLPDVVSSYFETFHGKAVLLGSSNSPDCLDCHANKGSVHEMHASSDPRSSVHVDNRAATCQTGDCHVSAAPALASFDVHANRDRKTHALEFGVGLFFVFLTLAVLLPMLTFNVLGLIRELFPSHQAEEEIEHLVKIAERRAAREGGIRRFSGVQRLQHVFLVVVFVLLCLTGFPMKFAQTSWAPKMMGLFGGIESARIVHRVAGVALLAGFMMHVVWVLMEVVRTVRKKGVKGPRAFIEEVLALSMIPKLHDLKHLIQCAKYVFFLSPVRPKYDRFCWKEKLEYLGVFWGTGLLGVTGILLWAESASSHVVPGWILNVAYLAHTYESFLAAAHIVLVHIPGVLGRPGVNPLSGMVIDGTISPRALAEEHGGVIEKWGTVKEVQ